MKSFTSVLLISLIFFCSTLLVSTVSAHERRVISSAHRVERRQEVPGSRQMSVRRGRRVRRSRPQRCDSGLDTTSGTTFSNTTSAAISPNTTSGKNSSNTTAGTTSSEIISSPTSSKVTSTTTSSSITSPSSSSVKAVLANTQETAATPKTSQDPSPSPSPSKTSTSTTPAFTPAATFAPSPSPSPAEVSSSSTPAAAPAATFASSGSSSSGSLSGLPSSLSGLLSGFATFFFQGGAAGACGIVHQDSDKIVALQSQIFSQSLCGKTVTITNTANGQSVTATVADECPGCKTADSLDLSTGAFNAIGDPNTGVLNINWKFS